jgi:glutathionylspermidine synthase
VLSPELHAAAIHAATTVVRAIGAIAERAHAEPAERARYGLSPSVMRLAAAAHRAGDHAALMRVDLLLGADGVFRACEINADCPGGHNEATGLPRLCQTAGFWQGLNPTVLLEELTTRLAALADRPGPGRGTVALLYATAYAEDLQVCALIERALRERGLHTVRCPATAPRLQGDAVYVGTTPVAVLYRFFPMEYMDGQRNLEGLITAVEDGRVRTLSSFSHIYSQSKLSFARAWARRDELLLADQRALAEHTPLTVELPDLPADQLLRERAQWVIKRALGRVGDEVFVGELFDDDDWANLNLAVQAAVHGPAQERWVAQRFVPQTTLATPYGDRLLTLGVYVLDGRFVGYFARLSPFSHVSHEALCVPVFTRVDPPSAQSGVPSAAALLPVSPPGPSDIPAYGEDA